jgi:hypothetical protein
MSSTTPLNLAAAALLLAVAACNVDKLEMTDSLVPPAAVAAMEVPPLAHELYRMFEDEKRDANVAELPAQF